MESLEINSNLISSVLVGKNALLFDFQGKTFMYERLNNTIHCGKREEIQQLASLAESIEYHPSFDGNKMIAQLTGKIGTLILGTTEACNLSCQYCINSFIYAYERGKSGRRMSWTTAKHAIDFFLENANPKPTIQFYGGEATLNLGVIRKCMEYASAKDPKVQFGITTNGLNIKRLYADLLNHDARITVSLDGPKEVHDKYRRNLRNEPTHEIIMRNIKIISDLSSEFVRSRLSVSATCWDLQDFTKIVDYFTELDGHYAGMFVGFVEKKGLSPITSKEHESTYKVIDDYLRYGLQYVHDIVQDVNPPGILKSLFDKHLSSLFTLSDITMPPQIPLDGVCLPGEFSIFVDVAGEFYICEKMIGILPIGNVHSGVKSRIKREAIRQLQSIRDAKCSPCWLSRLCRPCFAVAKDSNGNLTSAGLHERCHDYRDSKLVYLALFGELLHVDHERRHIEYFKNVNLEL